MKVIKDCLQELFESHEMRDCFVLSSRDEYLSNHDSQFIRIDEKFYKYVSPTRLTPDSGVSND